jgi:hypothetical protein
MSDTDPNDSSSAVPAQPYPDPIPGIIPFGTLTIFSGAPGVGKTALYAEWIARWRDGRTIFGQPAHAPIGGFYIIAADRQWASTQYWFDLIGYSDIPHYSLTDDLAINLNDIRDDRKGRELFEMALARLNPPPGAHVFVDPVTPLFITGNVNRSRDVASSMMGFSRLAKDHQINITCTGHFSKQKGDMGDRYLRPQDRIAGSGAFIGFTDTQMYLCDPEPDAKPTQPFHLFGWVPRQRPPQDFKLVRDDHGLFIPYRSLEDVGSVSNSDKRPLELFQWIPDGEIGIRTCDLETIAVPRQNVSRRTFYRYLDTLTERGLIERKHGQIVRVLNPPPYMKANVE